MCRLAGTTGRPWHDTTNCHRHLIKLPSYRYNRIQYHTTLPTISHHSSPWQTRATMTSLSATGKQNMLFLSLLPRPLTLINHCLFFLSSSLPILPLIDDIISSINNPCIHMAGTTMVIGQVSQVGESICIFIVAIISSLTKYLNSVFLSTFPAFLLTRWDNNGLDDDEWKDDGHQVS